jgi:ATP-dependent DNA ligase
MLPGSIVLDGEVVSSNFQELMTMLNRKVGKDTSAAKLALFDIIPLDDFKKGECATPLEDRHAILTSLSESGALQECTGGAVYVIPKIDLDLDTPEGQAAFRQFNIDALAAGYEGIMVKDPRSPYRCKRTAAWLKIKPTISVSLEVVDLEEGKAEGKRAGMLGALVCEGHEAGKDIRVNVGSGFTDEQLVEFWAHRSELVGMIAEIEADAFTKSRDSDTVWSLRFPRWKGWRGTAPGEKL